MRIGGSAELSVNKPYQRRRRFSREFKAQIVAQCQEPGASVSRISLDNGLNANMVRRWMKGAQRANKTPGTPGFVPVNLPVATALSGNPSVSDKRSTIRIELFTAPGVLVTLEDGYFVGQLLDDRIAAHQLPLLPAQDLILGVQRVHQFRRQGTELIGRELVDVGALSHAA